MIKQMNYIGYETDYEVMRNKGLSQESNDNKVTK